MGNDKARDERIARALEDFNSSKDDEVAAAIARMGNAQRVTMEVLYRLPDAPAILQTFMWQFDDVAPDYPRARQFIEFWDKNIEGKMVSVQVGKAKLVERNVGYRNVDAVIN